ncbi:MAG: hypothetical protein ABIJ96_08755 [Elusimicrobiota bacterium]
MSEAQFDPFKGWLSSFDNEVDKVLSGQSSPSLAPVRGALADFDDWWRREVPGTGDESEMDLASHQTSKELDISREEVRALKEDIGRLKSSPDMSSAAALRSKLEELTLERDHLREEGRVRGEKSGGEIHELKEHNMRLERELADLQLQLSRERDSFDGRGRQLEERACRLEDQLRDAKESRQFLESEHGRQGERLQQTENRLLEADTEKKNLQRQMHEMTRTQDELKRTLIDRDTECSALQRAVDELHAQATDLRERLIKSGDIDAGERQAGREELRRMSRRSEEIESQLAAGQREADAKIRETTRYLEMKIREIHDESKEQFGHFRELLDALVRFREEDR